VVVGGGRGRYFRAIDLTNTPQKRAFCEHYARVLRKRVWRRRDSVVHLSAFFTGGAGRSRIIRFAGKLP